ncbi:MAG: DUF805 domain-containing protein [Oceanicaulis sp.]
MDWGKVLFDPNGRIGQREFWTGVLVIIVGNLLVYALPVIGFLLWLILIWVGVAVYGKRLHDAGTTGWLHAIPWAVTIIMTIIAMVMVGARLFQLILESLGDSEPSQESIIGFIAASGGAIGMLTLGSLVWLGYTLWVGFLQSEPGANRYGPAPVIEGRAADAATSSQQSSGADD